MTDTASGRWAFSRFIFNANALRGCGSARRSIDKWDNAPVTKPPGMPGQSEEWPEWATDALDKAREDRDVPYTDAQILKATSVTFEGGNDGRFLTGWAAKHASEIEIDKDALGPPIGWVEGGHTDPTLPGIEPETPESRSRGRPPGESRTPCDRR